MSWTAPMKASFAVFVMMLGVWIAVVLLVFWPIKVFEFRSPICPLEPVYAGEVMLYRMNIIKHLPLPGTVTKQLYNATRTITLETIVSNAEVGPKDVVGRVRIYDDVQPGEYKFRWTAVFRVNGLRNEVVVSETPHSFKVLPARNR